MNNNNIELFRNYNMASHNIKYNYLKSRTNQTMDFVEKMHTIFNNFDTKMEIWDILEQLNSFTDMSDPDISIPNLYHAFQTAEMMRADNQPDWMQLVGLLHDIGKIMYKKGNDKDGTGIHQQWAIVGDTFAVGCKLPDTLIFSEFNQYNPDMENDQYNTTLGIYNKECGLDNVLFSWGHDEYLYKILDSNKNPNILPPEALYIIRFHSLYAYHNRSEYMYFQSEKDKTFFHWLKVFNTYDLYSKTDTIYEYNTLKEYYMKLIQKYFQNTYLYI